VRLQGAVQHNAAVHIMLRLSTMLRPAFRHKTHLLQAGNFLTLERKHDVPSVHRVEATAVNADAGEWLWAQLYGLRAWLKCVLHFRPAHPAASRFTPVSSGMPSQHLV